MWQTHRLQESQSHRGCTAVIHQPYFLPWLGYFSKLCFCDVLVLLDNVHFSKQHYIDRTKIIDMHGQVTWLSLPTGQNPGIPIRDVALRPPDNRSLQNVIETVRTSYSKAMEFDSEWPRLRQLLGEAFDKHQHKLMLLDIDVHLIKGLLTQLGITVPHIVLASEITSASDPTARLCDICTALDVTNLLVGAGRSRAVHNFESLRQCGISIQIQDYSAMHPVYSQSRRRSSGFVSGLSIIDALMNVGSERVRTFISEGRYSPTLLVEEYPGGVAYDSGV